MTCFQLLAIALCFGCSRAACASDIIGTVAVSPSGCPISNLVVEIDPVKGSPQAKVVTNTDDNGQFSAHILDGRYLIQLFQQGRKVYQKDTNLAGAITLPISLASNLSSHCASQAAVPINLSGPRPSSFSYRDSNSRDWRPNDLAMDALGNPLIVDDYGRIVRVYVTRTGFSSDKLATLPPQESPKSIAATGNNVLVTTQSQASCNLYSLDIMTSKVVSSQIRMGQNICSGVAADKATVYVVMNKDQEIRIYRDFDFRRASDRISIASLSNGATLALDQEANLLFVGDSSGTVYRVDLLTKKATVVARLPMEINSMGLSPTFLVVASGKTLKFYDRRTLKPLPTSSAIAALRKGYLAGVRVGGQGMWLLVRDQDNLIGPLSY